jgi:CRP/FNR family transcriptional regulator
MKITTLTVDGDAAIVALVYPGDFIGRPFADAIDHDVVAVTDVELCLFPRPAFERALDDHARMERLLLQRTLAELTVTRQWLARIGRSSAEARVAGCLADMARRLAISGCQRDEPNDGTLRVFDLPLSRSEIADLLGLTIETVSRQMTRLRAAGIIGLPGGRAIRVNNLKTLAQIAAD